MTVNLTLEWDDGLSAGTTADPTAQDVRTASGALDGRLRSLVLLYLYERGTGFRLMVDPDGVPLPTVPQAVNGGHQALVLVGHHPHLWTPCG